MQKDIAVIIEELKPVVAEIEKTPETCKGRYDKYMYILNKFPGKEKYMAAILVMAGANEYGVAWALKLTT